jgi:hypothetical protein
MKGKFNTDQTAKTQPKATGNWGNSKNNANSGAAHPNPGGSLGSKSLPNGWKRGNK